MTIKHLFTIQMFDKDILLSFYVDNIYRMKIQRANKTIRFSIYLKQKSFVQLNSKQIIMNQVRLKFSLYPPNARRACESIMSSFM